MGIAATASAVPVTLQSQQWYEWGRLYELDNDPLSPTFGDYVATNVNPYDGTGTQALTPGVYEGTDGTEDSFGTAAISGIFESGTTNYFYDRTTASSELTMFYSNGDDVMINPNPTLGDDFTQLWTDGFVARFYLDGTWDYQPGNNYAGRGSDNDGNVGADYYEGSTEGTLVLELTGHNRYLDYSETEEANDGDAYELSGMGNVTTGNVSGVIYLDATDGIWKDFFDTNTWDMSAADGYGFADFRLTTTMFPNIGETEWGLEGVSTAQGDIVPEPGTMILFGLGLLSLAGFRRRKIV